MKWLNGELKEDIKKVFEPRYKRKLSDKEVESIASNLVTYIEHYTKFIWRINNEQNTRV